MKRICITSDRLNSYQSRVLTSGMNIEQYQKNPVLLYMHERGQVIGYMKDLKVEDDGTITGEPVYDEATELSKRCKAQYEFGSLRMASVGIDILEMSEDPALLVPGQTRPTVTKSKLFEVSMVDIGANDDAIRLHKDGQLIELGKDGTCQLPLINNNQNQKQVMELKDFALILGMPETATEEEVRQQVAKLKKASDDAVTLQKEKDQLQLAAITTAVETAISEKRLNAEKKQQFIELGKKTGLEELNNILGAMAPQVKLSAVIGHQGSPSNQPATYQKLSDVPADKLMELRSDNPDEYKRLYKAEYGMDCEL